MFKRTSTNENFRNRTGSSAMRGVSNSPLHILPSIKAQYETLKVDAHAVSEAMEKATSLDERKALRIRMANLVREIGDKERLLKNGSRLAFEAVFVQVASGRLPKDQFLLLVQEAREIWQAEGYADYVPPMTPRERNKAEKRNLRK